MSEKDNLILEMLKDGKSYSDIQVALNVSPSKIVVVKKKYYIDNPDSPILTGITTPDPPPTTTHPIPPPPPPTYAQQQEIELREKAIKIAEAKEKMKKLSLSFPPPPPPPTYPILFNTQNDMIKFLETLGYTGEYQNRSFFYGCSTYNRKITLNDVKYRVKIVRNKFRIEKLS